MTLKELDERISEFKMGVAKLESQRLKLRDDEVKEKIERYRKQLVVEFESQKPGERFGSVFAQEMPGIRELRIVVRAADDATQEAKDYLQAYACYPKRSVTYVMFEDTFVGRHGGGHVFVREDLTGINKDFIDARMIEDAVSAMGYKFLKGGEESGK